MRKSLASGWLRMQKLKPGAFFWLTFKFGIFFAQPFQLFEKFTSIKSHSHNHGAYSPVGRRYHCFQEKGEVLWLLNWAFIAVLSDSMEASTDVSLTTRAAGMAGLWR